MRQIIIGQILLIICCVFYCFYWYTGYNPNNQVSRSEGIVGTLLMLTAFFGVAGLLFCFMPSSETSDTQYRQLYIILGGIAAYIILLFVTKYGFQRIVTTELFLIVGWTMLEFSILNRLSGSSLLIGPKLIAIYLVIILAFVISMILYVAYYRMEEMKAFYAALVPLITEAISMAVLVVMLLNKK